MDVLRKPLATIRASNLPDPEAARASFDWAAERSALEAAGGDGGFNLGTLALDRHLHDGLADQPALRWLGKSGAQREFSYRKLAQWSSRFASALQTLGVQPGERVFLLMGRLPELPIAMLGALKHRCVVAPLFSAFGPEPIATRMTLGECRVLVTSASLYRRKIEPMRTALTTLRHVLLVRDDEEPLPPGTQDLQALLAAASLDYVVAHTDAQTPALPHFTSGTTGKPKAALHVHEALVTHVATARMALDLRRGDRYWCTADPGWVTGTSYGVLAPLGLGATLVVDEAEFDAERWYGILEAEQVSVWYTAPTAIRMLMKAGATLAKKRAYPALRFIASVGEPLNPEAVWWGMDAFGMPIHDNWWQTETGGIMIANTAAMDVKPGSMGKPLPGVEAAIAHRDAKGIRFVDNPREQGELVLRAGWPSMFRGYLDQEERYRKCFAEGWYFTGDLAKRDADGYYWFVGRADDVIKSAGHLIGPFEVESVLLEHPAVAEAGVIGKPDPVAMEVVKAFVSLREGVEPGEALRRELLAFARSRLGAVVAPKEIAFQPGLPKTRSGKIMRRLLRDIAEGRALGDTTTLADPAVVAALKEKYEEE